MIIIEECDKTDNAVIINLFFNEKLPKSANIISEVPKVCLSAPDIKFPIGFIGTIMSTITIIVK